MARFFFNLLGALRWADEDGEDLPDLASAHHYALARFRMMARGEPHLSMQVTSGDGTTLFIISAGQQSPYATGHWLN